MHVPSQLVLGVAARQTTKAHSHAAVPAESSRTQDQRMPRGRG